MSRVVYPISARVRPWPGKLWVGPCAQCGIESEPDEEVVQENGVLVSRPRLRQFCMVEGQLIPLCSECAASHKVLERP